MEIGKEADEGWKLLEALYLLFVAFYERFS